MQTVYVIKSAVYPLLKGQRGGIFFDMLGWLSVSLWEKRNAFIAPLICLTADFEHDFTSASRIGSVNV